MLKAMRMASLRCKMSVILIEMIAGIIVMSLCADQIIAEIEGPVDLLTVPTSELDEVEYGTLDLSQVYVLGCYSVLYGSYQGDAYYYLIYVGNINTGLGKYMGIKVKRNHKQIMDKLTERSLAILEGTNVEDTESDGIVITGKVTSMEGMAYLHFKSSLNDIGFTDTDIQVETLNLMLIDENELKTYIFLGIGGALVLASILQVLYILIGFGQNQLKKELKKKGESSFSLAEQDFINAENFGPYVRIGQIHTFLVTGAKNHILQNNEIIWVYMRVNNNRHKKTTATTRWIIVYTKERKLFKTRMLSEGQAGDAIDKYHSLSKRIVLGFNPSLKELYENDFGKFLDLAYNSQDGSNYTEEI